MVVRKEIGALISDSTTPKKKKKTCGLEAMDQKVFTRLSKGPKKTLELKETRGSLLEFQYR